MANLDGSNEVQIGIGGSSRDPWASADGSQLVVSASEDDRLLASVSRLDGLVPHFVPQPAGVQFGSGPFSPDGRQLVVEGFTAPGFAPDHTYVVDIDSGKIQTLTSANFIAGDVSPGGSSVLLFRGSDTGSRQPRAPGRLWIVGMSGANLGALTPTRIQVQCCSGY